MLGPGLAVWAARLDQETGNMRAARSWCAEDQARAGMGLELAAGLWPYWHPRGQLREAADWLEDALARGSGPDRARAAALGALGLIASFRGEQEQAQDLLTASIECAQRCGYQHAEARALTHLSQARVLCGDLVGAAEAGDRALTLARQAGDAWVEGVALFRCAIVKVLSGDIAGAKSLQCVYRPVPQDRRPSAPRLWPDDARGLPNPGRKASRGHRSAARGPRRV